MDKVLEIIFETKSAPASEPKQTEVRVRQAQLEYRTYKHFKNMHKHMYCELVEVGVVERLPRPIWMSREGKEYSLKDAFRCMVAHKLCHPDRYFVGQEVDGETST